MLPPRSRSELDDRRVPEAERASVQRCAARRSRIETTPRSAGVAREDQRRRPYSKPSRVAGSSPVPAGSSRRTGERPAERAEREVGRASTAFVTAFWPSRVASAASSSPISEPASRRSGRDRCRGRARAASAQDLQVDARRAVLDVPDVELDPVLPRQRRPPVDLRPAGQAGPDLEPLRAGGPCTSRPGSGASAAARSGSSRRGGRSRAAAARRSSAGAAARPTRVMRRSPRVDREAGALLLRADDHRPQLQQLEVLPVLPDPRLPVEDRAAVLELDRERRGGEQRAREREPEPARPTSSARFTRPLGRVPRRGTPRRR